jgi:hypothetical protein
MNVTELTGANKAKIYLVGILDGDLGALAVLGDAASDGQIEEIVSRWTKLVQEQTKDNDWAARALAQRLEAVGKDKDPRRQKLVERIQRLTMRNV